MDTLNKLFLRILYLFINNENIVGKLNSVELANTNKGFPLPNKILELALKGNSGFISEIE